MLIRITLILTLFLTLATGGTFAANDPPPPAQHQITVMARNV